MKIFDYKYKAKRMKDGKIHSDSKTKIVTVLLYLNEKWDAHDLIAIYNK